MHATEAHQEMKRGQQGGKPGGGDAIPEVTEADIRKALVADFGEEIASRFTITPRDGVGGAPRTRRKWRWH
nr:hypothetical protein [Candidatus Sigynarchaeota archaeon]